MTLANSVFALSLRTMGVSMGVLLLAACGGDSSSMEASAVGGDIDANGCRPSAGYQWCEYTQACERPWELAQANGFENTPGAYSTFCAHGPDVEEEKHNPLRQEPSVTAEDTRAI